MANIKPIEVEYIDHMGSDKRVTNVARVSFNKWEDESNDITARDSGLISYLATGLPSSERDNWELRVKAHTHWSPFAHCFLSLSQGQNLGLIGCSDCGEQKRWLLGMFAKAARHQENDDGSGGTCACAGAPDSQGRGLVR